MLTDGITDHEAAIAEWLEKWRFQFNRLGSRPIRLPDDQIARLHAAFRDCRFGEKNSWIDWVSFYPAVQPLDTLIVFVTQEDALKMALASGDSCSKHVAMAFDCFRAANVPIHEDWSIIHLTWATLAQPGRTGYAIKTQTLYIKNDDVAKDIVCLQKLIISGKPSDKLDSKQLPSRCNS